MSEEIKFTHAPEGSIQVNGENTAFDYLFTIGALHLTRKTTFKGDIQHNEYATDRHGLEKAVSMSKGLSDALHLSIESIGTVLGTIDAQDLGTDTTTLGWLLAGLSRLAIDVDNSRGEMQQALSQSEKAA